MSNKIILKKSAVSGKIPLPSDLEVGELAVNLVDKKFYTKNPSGEVVEVGGAAAASAIEWSNILHTPTTLAGYGITDAAPIDSPSLTGIPTAPTPDVVSNNNQIATTNFVKKISSAKALVYAIALG